MTDRSVLHLSGNIRVDGGERYPHVMRRLRAGLPAIGWHVQSASGEVRPPVLRLSEDDELPEGAFRVSVDRRSTDTPTVDVVGGPFSGVIYGVNELIRRARIDGQQIAIDSETVEMTPGLTYRTFWTWDHSTNWELTQIGHQEIGVFNPYGKPPGGFLADYKRLVDFCSDNRIAAIVVYGFLRDSHGGIEGAQELCRYANERAVRILPGIAIGAYGGVYWEGTNRRNLATWLKSNPQFASSMEHEVGFQIDDLAFPLSFPHSDYTVSACPSAPETIAWMEDSVSWLAETFAIGGINIESGDYGVCGCDRCVMRRLGREDAERRDGVVGDSWSHADMADNFPPLYSAATAKRDNLWIYSELQWDTLLDPDAPAPSGSLPHGAIYQHTLNRSYWRRLKRSLTADDVSRLATRTNVLRCQFASQWNGDERTERYRLNARDFAEVAKMVDDVGMQGLTVWGEASPFFAAVEISYLAFARFAYEPALTWNRFVREDVAPLMGGSAEADLFIEMCEEFDADAELSSSRLKGMRLHALAAAESRGDGVARRWLTLADQIARREFMLR